MAIEEKSGSVQQEQWGEKIDQVQVTTFMPHRDYATAVSGRSAGGSFISSPR